MIQTQQKFILESAGEEADFALRIQNVNKSRWFLEQFLYHKYLRVLFLKLSSPYSIYCMGYICYLDFKEYRVHLYKFQL